MSEFLPTCEYCGAPIYSQHRASCPVLGRDAATTEQLSARWQELFWALHPGEMRHKLRSLEIDVSRMLREAGCRADRNLLRGALVGLVGVDGREDLEQLEATMRLLPAPAADKAATIDAIHALLATL